MTKKVCEQRPGKLFMEYLSRPYNNDVRVGEKLKKYVKKVKTAIRA